VRFLRFLVHFIKLLEIGIFKNCGYVLVYLLVEVVLVGLKLFELLSDLGEVLLSQLCISH